MKRPEQNLQIACVRWFRMQYPNVLIHHSPNGGARSKVEGAIFKAMGTVAGFPDIIIPCAKYGYHGLFIEMKSPGGKMSDNQKQVSQKLISEGYCFAICESIEQFIDIVKSYM